MVAVAQGEVWWADFGEPMGSGPEYRRPLLVVQGDAFNRSAISTVVCVPLTSNVKWAGAPGNVPLEPRDSGLPKESVANVSQVVALDRAVLVERVAKVPAAKLDLVLRGIDLVLGRA
ncbi:MAG: type II toxin-antitoxin system PemK/MazF family toxin [Myxococcota bacterium]